MSKYAELGWQLYRVAYRGDYLGEYYAPDAKTAIDWCAIDRYIPDKSLATAIEIEEPPAL